MILLYKYIPFIWKKNWEQDSEKELALSRFECIKESTLYFSTPEQLNDPFDCSPSFQYFNDISDFELCLNELDETETKLILEKFPKCSSKKDVIDLMYIMKSQKSVSHDLGMLYHFNLIKSIIEMKISNLGILSLTTDYRNCLMWSHYAQNHSGICIEYEFPNSLLSLRPVQYVNEQPLFSLYEALHQKFGKLQELFYTKSKHWEYENEYRMVALTGREKKKIDQIKISRIIFGINTSDDTKEKIKSVVDDTHQLKLSHNYNLI